MAKKLPELWHKSGRRKKIIILIAAAAFMTAAAISLQAYMKYTSSPEYCATCHVMSEQYEDWFYSGAHKSIKCIDCHLPNDGFIRHYFWKGADGMKDVFYFYTGLVPEIIHSSAHAKKTIQSNCIRCHGETVSRISTGNMRCWECHRANYHNIIN
jgi:cytochrome c nitrite reductase small subunit